MTDDERELLSYVIFMTLFLKKKRRTPLTYSQLQRKMGPYWEVYNYDLDEPVEFIDYINWLAESLSEKGYVDIAITSNTIWFTLTEKGNTVEFFGRPTPDYVANWVPRNVNEEYHAY